jgi:hypothetical protein
MNTACEGIKYKTRQQSGSDRYSVAKLALGSLPFGHPCHEHSITSSCVAHQTRSLLNPAHLLSQDRVYLGTTRAKDSSICGGVSRLRRPNHHVKTDKKAAVRYRTNKSTGTSECGLFKLWISLLQYGVTAWIVSWPASGQLGRCWR